MGMNQPELDIALIRIEVAPCVTAVDQLATCSAALYCPV